MTSTDQRIAPGQPGDPAMFAPLSFEEIKVLRGHLASGWYKQSVVCPGLSGPYQETAGLLPGRGAGPHSHVPACGRTGGVHRQRPRR